MQKIYSEVARTYELVNHVLTFGLDMRWRRRAAQAAVRGNGTNWLDVCSGTGEMAQNLLGLAGGKARVTSVDFSYPMLIRAKSKPALSGVSFVLADARRLPFRASCFDLITISFATRNIAHTKQDLTSHLAEFLRILKPGGRFVNLETSQPSLLTLRRFFHLYVALTVKPIGSLLSGSKAGYSYLSYTIPRFHSAEEFSALLTDAGFARVDHLPLLFGAAAIHIARKGHS